MTWTAQNRLEFSDHLKNCHPKFEWGDNSSGGISWGDNSTGGNLWGVNSSGGNYEEKTMKQAIIWMLLSANRNNVATENV